MKWLRRIGMVVVGILGVLTTLHAQLNTERLTAIGRNALYFEDYVLSIQYFNRVIQAKPYLAEPYLFRAIAKIQLGDMNGAERDCSVAINNNPFLPGAYYTRGYIYRQTNRMDQAEEDFDKALQFAPENRTYILMRADVRAQQEKYDDALQDINFLLRKEPTSSSLYFEKGVIELSKGDTIAALACFKKTTEYDTQNAANWSAKGHANLMLGNENEAYADFTQAINLGSKWAGDYINRGIILYNKHHYRGALADYDKAIEYNPRNAQCYYNRGLLRHELGDYNNALADFSQAIDLDPTNTDIHYFRGLTNMQLQQWKDATADFDALIARYPYFLPSYYLAAQAQEALGNSKTAYRYQSKAADLEKNKEQIQKQKHLNTQTQVAAAQPQKQDKRKEFSQRAAQNQPDQPEERQYESQTRGAIQNHYVDIINEPNIMLSYYVQTMPLRRTNYAHILLNELASSKVFPAPLHLTPYETPLTAELAMQHFEAIDRITNSIATLNNDDSKQEALLYFARAMEFAMVQDYSSAIDDCDKALTINDEMCMVYFCRANWRYKFAEYQLNNNEETATDKRTTFRMEITETIADYDKLLEYCPDFSFGYYNKANMQCMLNKYEDAILNYTKAINSDNDFAEAYFNRGLTYVFIGENEKGLADLSKAGELGIYQAYHIITRLQD